MLRDPFYRDICVRLQGQLDPELFEQCAADILRAIYPSLVPIRGGSDSGMDGAIADEEAEPFPLITTTSPKVIDNLTRNLTTYVRDGGRRRKVILATSQELTPKRKSNLFQRASDLGFTLIQIHDQVSIANLLYRDPRWCRELLGLTGEPPALSAIPWSDRPMLSEVLIGRGDDLDWLNASNGDLLIIGQPGSGKTALLSDFVRKGKALFVISSDIARIAADVRSNQPAIVIVDDAHIHIDLLRNLRHLRTEIGATFVIFASCWPGEQEVIISRLDLPSKSIRELQPLTRNEIVEVVKSTGIIGPNSLIRELVDQADGRPGLAVTLTHLCLRGDVRSVFSGSVLARSLLDLFINQYGRKVSALLATFALGGHVGMSKEVVSAALGIPPLELWEMVSHIAASGTLSVEDRRWLSVQPEPLRHSLVREVFFTLNPPFGIEEILSSVPDPSETLLTLIGARARGGAVPFALLVTLLEQDRSTRCWEAFASLGKEEALWVLNHRPSIATAIASPLLMRAPERTIPLLLDAAVGDDRALHATPQHPLRITADWVNQADPGRQDAIYRREILLNSVTRWLADGGSLATALRTVPMIMLPTFESGETDPGAGMTYTIHYGYLSVDLIKQLQLFWPRIHNLIIQAEIRDWDPVQEMIRNWAYPSHRGAVIAADLTQELKAFASQMLQDLLPHIQAHPGLIRWATGVAHSLGQKIDVERNPYFDLLYPEDRYDQDVYKRQLDEVSSLAIQWRGRAPKEAIADIVAIEQAARLARINWPRFTPHLCHELAYAVDDPAEWCATAIEAEISGDLIEPFLRASAETKNASWESLAVTCLKHPYLKGVAISVVLQLAEPPDFLLNEVLRQTPDFIRLIETMCIRNQIPEPTLKLLFQYHSAGVSGAAVWGEWSADPSGSVRSSLLADWKQAVVIAQIEDYAIAQLIAKDGDLAFDWFSHRLGIDNFPFYQFEQSLGMIPEVLTINQRIGLLKRVSAQRTAFDVIKVLVGDDLLLFQALLKLDHLRAYHLAPLQGVPDAAWILKALLALDAGYNPDSIASAVYPFTGVFWHGEESVMWNSWVEHFEKLSAHPDPRIREVGESGRAYATSKREKARTEERHEAVKGLRR